jgi:uncharacterized RmlC-like cupin family protein
MAEITQEHGAASLLGCALVRPRPSADGPQGFSYASAVSAQSVGAKALHMQLLTMPPGAKSRAHKHVGHETAIYVLSGVAGTWFGEQLEHHVTSRTGDFVYIAANVPHLAYNMSDKEPCVAVVARTDPNDQESVVLLPELDGIHP